MSRASIDEAQTQGWTYCFPYIRSSFAASSMPTAYNQPSTLDERPTKFAAGCPRT